MADMDQYLREALADGRQSPEAVAIARGVMRLLRAYDLAGLSELTLATGRRADIAALSPKGDVWIIEIKSSLADFRADLKWPEYAQFCDRYYFAVGRDFPTEVLPDQTGLIMADKYGGEIIREAAEARLAPARRKAVQLCFARSSAFRLMTALDPDC